MHWLGVATLLTQYYHCYYFFHEVVGEDEKFTVRFNDLLHRISSFKGPQRSENVQHEWASKT